MNTRIFQPCVLLSWMLVLSGALRQNSCTSDEFLQDDCQYQFDGICDDDDIICQTGTDCFDCDPCQDYSFTSCQNCTANGCMWCGLDAICVDAAILIQLEAPPSLRTFTCTAEDFKNSCDSNSRNVFPDPLYDAQSWIYDQINVKEVWRAGITGIGIGIRINDNGVDAFHPEFSSKFVVSSSCEEYLPVASSDHASHGTACAALSAGSANDVCSVGIAPNATLSACRMAGEDLTVEDLTPEFFDSSYLYLFMDNMHISSNSYGVRPCNSLPTERRLQAECPFSADAEFSPCSENSTCASVDWSNPQPYPECEMWIAEYCRRSFEDDAGCIESLDVFVDCFFNSMTQEEQDAFVKGVTEGRDGKGIIYVFASGNEFALGSDVNFDGALNSRLTISVGAVGKDGKHASYSTSGASLFISAPGGDQEFYRNNVVALAGGGCTDAGVGTSFAAPVVSGVVALILQVNPELTWRDVQGILALTSQKTDPNDSSWVTNTAGFNHSYKYGFGLVDAGAAVNAAKNWVNYSPEQQIQNQSGSTDLSIAEYPAGSISSKVTIVASDAFLTESVVVYLNLTHSSRGDLKITLTSPGGTQSLLSPGKRPENEQTDEYWKLMTVRNWGESAGGEWTISLVDESAGDVSECVDIPDWVLEIRDGFDLVEIDCLYLEAVGACEDGGEGPAFGDIFYGVTGLSDPWLADENGVTPDVACCACGGSKNASDVADMLKSWRIVVYGHGPLPSATSTTSLAKAAFSLGILFLLPVAAASAVLI